VAVDGLGRAQPTPFLCNNPDETARNKRSYNPILREAALDREALPVPWLHNRPVVFVYP
jgi:hypothetical protein